MSRCSPIKGVPSLGAMATPGGGLSFSDPVRLNRLPHRIRGGGNNNSSAKASLDTHIDRNPPHKAPASARDRNSDRVNRTPHGLVHFETTAWPPRLRDERPFLDSFWTARATRSLDEADDTGSRYRVSGTSGPTAFPPPPNNPGARLTFGVNPKRLINALSVHQRTL